MFLFVLGYEYKNPGGPLNMIFFQGFLSQGTLFQELNLHSSLFRGWRVEIFFRYNFFPRDLGFNSRGLMSQTITFQPGHNGF